MLTFGREKQQVYIVNWDFITQYLLLYQKAAVLTLQIGVLGILASIAIGIVCTMIHYFKVPIARRVVSVYVEISRNTPLLIQLFFIYYGLPKIGIRTNPYACGVAGLAFLGGSYMTEAFRSGIEAVDKVQTESAASLGLSGLQILRYVIFPQALTISFPAFMANVIFLLSCSRRQASSRLSA